MNLKVIDKNTNVPMYVVSTLLIILVGFSYRTIDRSIEANASDIEVIQNKNEVLNDRIRNIEIKLSEIKAILERIERR